MNFYVYNWIIFQFKCKLGEFKNLILTASGGKRPPINTKLDKILTLSVRDFNQQQTAVEATSPRKRVYR